jgi:EAL domain-containing protein (putative c-di-GMP-specific phosphodiesterase class I)
VRVVAEGIGTEDELSGAIDTGAHFGSGYLLRGRLSDPKTKLASGAQRRWRVSGGIRPPLGF